MRESGPRLWLHVTALLGAGGIWFKLITLEHESLGVRKASQVA